MAKIDIERRCEPDGLEIYVFHVKESRFFGDLELESQQLDDGRWGSFSLIEEKSSKHLELQTKLNASKLFDSLHHLKKHILDCINRLDTI